MHHVDGETLRAAWAITASFAVRIGYGEPVAS
jgi:hypothetical protein